MQIIEYPDGATPLEPEEMEGLKLRHITMRSELDRWEQANIQEAFEWVARRRKTISIISETFLCQLHEKMFGKVWKWAGTFRHTNKNIGVEWPYISVELKMLLDDVNFWIDNKTYPPEEITYRFHHKLVWIHLFPNGNGRHSRMIADILLTKVFDLKAFSWGSGNLVEAGVTRKQYITALKAADRHDYSLLQAFVIS
ncbi:MAG TPA: mobile mystery protein B [Puia sp.]|jgi:Fic-DOC domain mobile mystery protein B|nr:mobile mystery protein B [Puia sp.]